LARKPDAEKDRLDDAARAGWLYYIAGNTQDEIAKKLGVSRQTAQRFVSLAVSERLIKVRFDHPLGRCLELSERLRETYGLISCEVVPADATSNSETLGIAEAAATELERYLVSQHPVIIGLGFALWLSRSARWIVRNTKLFRALAILPPMVRRQCLKFHRVWVTVSVPRTIPCRFR
jgi:DNA-binding transcriptional regulator LsrR (DeoR family)